MRRPFIGEYTINNFATGNESGAWNGNSTANMQNAASTLGLNFGGGGGYYPG